MVVPPIDLADLAGRIGETHRPFAPMTARLNDAGYVVHRSTRRRGATQPVNRPNAGHPSSSLGNGVLDRAFVFM